MMGTATFSAVAADVYDPIALEFSCFHFEAIIDDLHILIPKQVDDDAWHAAYYTYARFRKTYAAEWAKRGGSLAKSRLLLPPEAPWPKPGILPPEVTVTKDGMTIVGSDIGSLSFREEKFSSQVDKIEAQLLRLNGLRLPDREHHLLSINMAVKCINTRLHYYARVNPLSEFQHLLIRHDDLLRQHNQLDLDLASLVVPACAPERQARADAILEQPQKASAASVGRTPLAVVASTAWCAGVLDAAASPLFCLVRDSLDQFCKTAHESILALLGEMPFDSWPSDLIERLPTSHLDLTNGPFAHNLLLSYKQTRVQGTLVQTIMGRRLQALDDDHSVSRFQAQQGSVPNPIYTINDVVGFQVMRFRSWASKAINYQDRPTHDFQGRHFVPYMRIMLLLPQLVRSGAHGPGGAKAGESQRCHVQRPHTPSPGPLWGAREQVRWDL